MMSIFKFTDGYYAVGEEGAKKAFVPDFQHVELILAHKKIALHLGGELWIRHKNLTLKEYFNV